MGVISVVTASFRPHADIVAPPYTSKVSRSIVIKCLEIYGHRDLALEVERPRKKKPYLFSPIFYDNKPLYKTVKSVGLPLTLRRDVEYWFKFSVVGEEVSFKLLESLMGAGADVPLLSGSVEILLSEVRVVRFEDLGFDPKGLTRIHARFITPALIQLPRPKTLKGKLGVIHRLYPIPSLIVYSLATHWNQHAPDRLKIGQVEKLSKLSDYILAELDHNIRPTTVIYDEKRRPRGFTGWILYKWNPTGHKTHETHLLKLLDYARHVGIGRSRASGFGITEITPKHQPQNSK